MSLKDFYCWVYSKYPF